MMSILQLCNGRVVLLVVRSECCAARLIALNQEVKPNTQCEHTFHPHHQAIR